MQTLYISVGTNQFDLFCTSTALLRLAYFDIFANLVFLLVEKYRSKYSFDRRKEVEVKFRHQDRTKI